MRNAVAGRAAFVDLVARALAAQRDTRQAFCVMLVDLDRFRVVNDTFGRDVGDRVLSAAATRIDTIADGHGTVSPLGSDGFALLLDCAIDEATDLARRLVATLRNPFEAGTARVAITASAGVVGLLPAHERADDLLRDAETALHTAKQRGRDRVATFSVLDAAKVRVRARLEHELRGAASRGEFVLEYQPIVDVVGNRVVACEALVRWQHPTRGLIGPAGFLDVAEDTGTIAEIDRWVLGEACRQLAEWRVRAGAAPAAVHVNVSGRNFADRGMVRHVAAALDTTGIEPGALCVEVTETSALTASDATRRALLELRDLGCSVAIDDFGTGYSSLATVRRLPAEILKLDRSLVAGLGTEPRHGAVLAAAVDLANALDMRVVAEGVEEVAHTRALLDLGCTVVQGYLLARPLAPNRVTDFCAGRRPRDPVPFTTAHRHAPAGARRGRRARLVDEFLHQLGLPADT